MIIVFLVKPPQQQNSNQLFNCYIIISILFIVQCWPQASKPEPLKQDTQKEK